MKRYISVVQIAVVVSAALFAVLQVQAQNNADSGTQAIDTRIVSQSYWLEMARRGLVKVAPKVAIKKAVFTSSRIQAPGVVTQDSPDIAITTIANTTQSENSVFVHPLDVNTILNSNNSTNWLNDSVTSFYGADAFFSTNGGQTWDGDQFGPVGTNRGDPAAVIGRNGWYYVGYIAFNKGQGVARSSDGGAGWTHAQVAPNPGTLADKNHLWVDNSPSSPFEGHLYSAWTDFGGTNDDEIVLSRSTDEGLTWSAPINISSAVSAGSHNQGVNIQTGPDGEVYATWAIYDSWTSGSWPDHYGADEVAIGFASSTDGGQTFGSATRIIENIRGIRLTRTFKEMRVNSFPVMAVDISSCPNRGTIYIVWTNYGVPGVNNGPDMDIYMIKSTDGGSTWSAPIRVNQDPAGQGNEHFFPWITCDPLSGDLSVIFYDDRNVDSTSCEVFVANSIDGGETWVDFRVGDVLFTPSPVPGLAGGYFGDYLGITARAGRVYPCWTDNRSGRALAYVSPYRLGQTVPALSYRTQLDGGSRVSLDRPGKHVSIQGDTTLLASYIFEVGPDCSPQGWTSWDLSGRGDFAGLCRGLALHQEDDLCRLNFACLWNFITGSTDTYACGGHPSQAAVPHGNAHGQYLMNEIWSPGIPWEGNGNSAELRFEVYRDLSLSSLVFYVWHVRSWVGGVPGPWRDSNFAYYGRGRSCGIICPPISDEGAEWFTVIQPFGDLVEQGADSIQIALGAWDMYGFWSLGSDCCHSHAPLLDTVDIYRISTTGPMWSVRDIDLFQDTFPSNGTLSGGGRADAALDVTSYGSGAIEPGDSCVIFSVADPDIGIGYHDPGDPSSGPAVYCWVSVLSKNNPPDAFTMQERDAANEPPSGLRWPLVDSLACNTTLWGDEPTNLRSLMWYKFQMDTSFAQPGRLSPVTDRFCVDLNDNGIFMPGDTILYFFHAKSSDGSESYYSREVGATSYQGDACGYPMEFQILPTRNTDILYVDDFDGRGAQPHFDWAFRMLGIAPDRYDINGPSSNVGNGLGSRVSNIDSLLIGPPGDPIYRKIIWNSGDLSAGLVGDGTGNPCDEDDWLVLYNFIDQHTSSSGAGIYFSGDDLAEEWVNLAGASAIEFRNTYMNFDLTTGDHRTLDHRISPWGVGLPLSMFIHMDVMPPVIDALIVLGGCPILNDFDVLEATGSATAQMAYDSVASSHAIIAQSSTNARDNPVGVVLSGFSYHHIRDDQVAPPPDGPDHVHHLRDILQWIGNVIAEPVAIKPNHQFANSLAQNYPNPFNPRTTIKYSIKERAHVSVKIYSVTGQLVRTLVNERQKPKAEGYTIQWDGRNFAGDPVSSGVYFCKLTTRNFTRTKKMVLLR
ncbi:MAG: T9SS type A sorting domain-containing protein [Candidatus Latescibacteria bacterium]|nr:T9SS type A sorting domain-containing protein [Candidatus Latescibacterota bacterium]NIO29015.1 T9SS type A sorting domain-containing protein [Candidatus Latescibacterota bacterium]NIO56640.1 T9SS type A sorting domain-containing protein [Candidatus Latescibacterota bacterium]NIT02223.1 T9SS type A sorting domain-containing protein [Candidatus Latescibacterota bacterium]NIT39108.1 T9SS type A sorting domain-containing protein [Candidatus Latescibacterota bacterium]